MKAEPERPDPQLAILHKGITALEVADYGKKLLLQLLDHGAELHSGIPGAPGPFRYTTGVIAVMLASAFASEGELTEEEAEKAFEDWCTMVKKMIKRRVDAKDKKPTPGGQGAKPPPPI